MKHIQYAVSLIFLRHFATREANCVCVSQGLSFKCRDAGRSLAVHIPIAKNPAGSPVAYCHVRTHSSASQKSGLNGLAHAWQFCGVTNA